MSDLPDFLLARIAEDEAVAREAAQWTDGRAEWGDDDPDSGDPDEQHIARHDPARVLAECEAKRRIVREFTDGSDPGEWGDGALRYLAVPFADHPDYRKEWKP